MNYIIYDLEFNQKDHNIQENNYELTTNHKLNNISNIPFEIIQIGALKLNDNFQTVSTFNSLIKPIIYKSIHPHVEKLTQITNDKISSSRYFIDVYNDFLNFIGDQDAILCVWGVVDIKELVRNLQFHNLQSSHISKYIDIQKHTSQYLKFPSKYRIGLKNAIERLNLPINREFHDAFNDAYYTAEIFKIISNNMVIKPSVYSCAPPKRICKPKDTIDVTSLIHQFEKMYDREISEEEKSMIKLAYMMGKTKQFVVKKMPKI